MKLTSYIFSILFFLMFVFPASAGLNITVQSENNKTLSIVNLQTYSTVAAGANNQTFSNLPYTNYEVRLLSNSNLTVSDAVGFFEGTWSKFVYLALILLIVFFIYYMAMGLSK